MHGFNQQQPSLAPDINDAILHPNCLPVVFTYVNFDNNDELNIPDDVLKILSDGKFIFYSQARQLCVVILKFRTTNINNERNFAPELHSAKISEAKYSYE